MKKQGGSCISNQDSSFCTPIRARQLGDPTVRSPPPAQAHANTEQYQRMADSADVVHGEREALQAKLEAKDAEAERVRAEHELEALQTEEIAARRLQQIALARSLNTWRQQVTQREALRRATSQMREPGLLRARPRPL